LQLTIYDDVLYKVKSSGDGASLSQEMNPAQAFQEAINEHNALLEPGRGAVAKRLNPKSLLVDDDRELYIGKSVLNQQVYIKGRHFGFEHCLCVLFSMIYLDS
jgi:hypothetical protein